MNLELLHWLLTIGLAVYVAIFSLRNRRGMKDIADSVERCCEVVASGINNIVKFRQPGVPRSAVIVSNDELDEAYRCTFRGKDEA